MHITRIACTAQQTLPLLPLGVEGLAGHRADSPFLPALPVGMELHTASGDAHFRVTGRVVWPCAGHAVYVPLLTALTHISAGQCAYTLSRKGWALAWITLSDKGAVGQREDTSGPAIEAMFRTALPLCHAQGFLLADDAPALRTLLTELALGQGYHIMCTTGGTGLGQRDVTPEATRAVLDRRLPGFEQAMMQASLARTPNAAISRAMAGVIGTCLCINLPGSAKAVRENLAAVLPALEHALDKLHGDTTDCGGSICHKI